MSLLLAAPYFFAITAEDFTLMRPWNLPDIDRHLAACNRRRPQICIERGWEKLAFSRKTYTLTVLAVQYLLPLAALAFSYARYTANVPGLPNEWDDLDMTKAENNRAYPKKKLFQGLYL
jgi:hypothetical protein